MEVWWFKLQEPCEEAAGKPDAHRACTKGESDAYRARTVGELDAHRARTTGEPDAHRPRTRVSQMRTTSRPDTHRERARHAPRAHQMGIACAPDLGGADEGWLGILIYN